MAVLLSLISPWKRKGEKRKKVITTRGKTRKGIKKRKNIRHCMAGKAESKKLEEYENENYYLFSDQTAVLSKYPRSLGREDNSVSQTDTFVNVNVFNSVTSAHVLSYRKSKLCKKTIINK